MMPRIALPVAIDAAAFADGDRTAPVIALDGTTMGTRWRVLYVADAASADAVRDAIERRLAGLVADMSHWEPASLLSRFNRAPAGTAMVLPPDFAQVMAMALAIARVSGGAFDPAIGALVDLWGHGPPGPMPRPTPVAIDAARARSGAQRLRWADGSRTLVQPGGVALDLSGIAKGHAVDAVADTLAAIGIRHTLVEIGGELAGRGIRPDGEPWWVDLETPPGLPLLPPLRIALHGIAVATSGSYVRGDHTLDPRTGYPATGGVSTCSVVASHAALADAWATVLSVLPPPEGAALADRHGVAARIVGAEGALETRALTAMIEG